VDDFDAGRVFFGGSGGGYVGFVALFRSDLFPPVLLGAPPFPFRMPSINDPALASISRPFFFWPPFRRSFFVLTRPGCWRQCFSQAPFRRGGTAWGPGGVPPSICPGMDIRPPPPRAGSQCGTGGLFVPRDHCARSPPNSGVTAGEITCVPLPCFKRSCFPTVIASLAIRGHCGVFLRQGKFPFQSVRSGRSAAGNFPSTLPNSFSTASQFFPQAEKCLV